MAALMSDRHGQRRFDDGGRGHGSAGRSYLADLWDWAAAEERRQKATLAHRYAAAALDLHATPENVRAFLRADRAKAIAEREAEAARQRLGGG